MKNILLFIFILGNLYSQEANLIPAIKPLIDEFLFTESQWNGISKVGMSTSNFSDDKTENDVSSLFFIQLLKRELNEDIALEGCVGITASLLGLDTLIDNNYDLGGYASIKYKDFSFKAGGTYLKQVDYESTNGFAMIAFRSYFIKAEIDSDGDIIISSLASNDFLERVFNLLLFVDFSTKSDKFSGGLTDLRFNIFQQKVFIEAPVYYDDGFNFRPGILVGTPGVMSLGLYVFVNKDHIGGSLNFHINLNTASSMWATPEETRNQKISNMIMGFSISYNDSFNNKSFNTKIYDKVITSISMSIFI